jgi:hypothetical protein
MWTKKFSLSDYKENDPKTKKLVANFMVSSGEYQLNTPTNEQPNAYKSHDFEAITTEGRSVLVEVERKKVWEAQYRWEPRFSTLDVPFRKNGSQAELFFMTNRFWNMLARIPMAAILNSPHEFKTTKLTNKKSPKNSST